MDNYATPIEPPGAPVPVAIYTRVSTDNQVGGRFDSCESQLAVCREFVTKNLARGWHEVAHFSDPAYSGSTMKRPGLQALMRLVEQGQLRVILIFKLERMSRNIDEFGPFRHFLRKHNCRLESATEDISEQTPSGRLKNNLMLSFSQYEKENTAEKTKVKMHQQALRGYWNGGAVPFGFRYDKNTQTLEPHPDEAPLVRRIFHLASKQVSLEQIATLLNNEGWRTRARVTRDKDGNERTVGEKRFRSDGLRWIVTNPIYRGAIRYAGQEHAGRHEALVKPETWELANTAAALADLQPPPQRLDQDKHFHLLKGLVHCACCERALVPHASGNRDDTGAVYRYYCCGKLIKERAGIACTVRRIPAGPLEEAVIMFLAELGRHPDVVDAAIGNSNSRGATRGEELREALRKLDRELAAMTARIRNCVDAIAGGGNVVADELSAELATIKSTQRAGTLERARLTQELSACDAITLDVKQVRESIERFGDLLKGLSPDDQKKLVRLFVDRIEVQAGASTSEIQQSRRRIDLAVTMNLPRLAEGIRISSKVGETSPVSSRSGAVIQVGIVLGQQGRAHRVAILSPFVSGDEQILKGIFSDPVSVDAAVRNPVVRAQTWARQLAGVPKLSLRELARREGIAAPTIVQHLKVLQLDPMIVDYVARLRNPEALRQFSLRKLLALSTMPVAQQRRVFRLLRTVATAPQTPPAGPEVPSSAPRLKM